MGPPPPVPRFVPTLTEVVAIAAIVQEASPALEKADAPYEPELPPIARSSSTQSLEEEIVHRVLQRIDILLDARLAGAVAAVAAAQARAMLPVLREEIDHTVRACVAEALALELSGGTAAHGDS